MIEKEKIIEEEEEVYGQHGEKGEKMITQKSFREKWRWKKKKKKNLAFKLINSSRYEYHQFFVSIVTFAPSLCVSFLGSCTFPTLHISLLINFILLHLFKPMSLFPPFFSFLIDRM